MYEYPNGDINSGKVILFLYAGYHSTCNVTLQMIDKVAKYHKDIKVIKVNTTKYYKIKEMYNIRTLPCIIYLIDGKNIDRLCGSLNYHLINNLINKNNMI